MCVYVWDAVKKNNETYKYRKFDQSDATVIEMVKNIEVADANCYPPPQA
jgi:hypothetical protein